VVIRVIRLCVCVCVVIRVIRVIRVVCVVIRVIRVCVWLLGLLGCVRGY
jgi:hypothetical protein